MIVIFAIVVGINCLVLLITWLIFWQNRRKRLLVQAASLAAEMKNGEVKMTDSDILVAPSVKKEEAITPTSSPNYLDDDLQNRKLTYTRSTPNQSRLHVMPTSYPLTPTIVVKRTATQESLPTPRDISPERDLESKDKLLGLEEVGDQVSLETIDESEELNIPTTTKTTVVNNSPSIEVLTRPTNYDEAWPESNMMRRNALTTDEMPIFDKTKRKFLFRNKKSPLNTTKRRSLSRRIRSVLKKRNKNQSSPQRDLQDWRTIALRRHGQKL